MKNHNFLLQSDVVRCAIWYHLYYLKNVKNTHGGVLKTNTPPWVFSTIFKLYKWYQIVQRITYMITVSYLSQYKSKHSLSMKFGQFISYYKWKNFIKKFFWNCDLKTNSRPFCVCQELSTTSIGKWNFWSKLLILDI